MNGKKVIGIIIVAVLVMVFAFALKVSVQRERLNRIYYGYGYMPGMRGRYGFLRGTNRFVFPRRIFQRGVLNGIITGISGNQITVKMPNGTIRTVSLSALTQYQQLSTVDQNSLKPGQNVTVYEQGINGTTSAQTVRINP